MLLENIIAEMLSDEIFEDLSVEEIVEVLEFIEDDIK